MALDAETRDQLIDTVRRFVAERLRPLEAKVAEEDAMPPEVVEEMKALGLFGLSIPEEYGGLDLSMEDECLVAVELGRSHIGHFAAPGGGQKQHLHISGEASGFRDGVERGPQIPDFVVGQNALALAFARL